MDCQKLIDMQNQIVVSSAGAIQDKWDAAVVNMEIDEIEGELKQNCICLFFKNRQDKCVRDSFLLPHECYELFISLREATANPDKWTICNLEIAADGVYEYQYSYDPPKRLNGVYDSEAMLTNYVPHV
jgi:hypothetical protein